MTLNDIQSKLCDDNQTDFSDLKAVVFNTSLKREEAKSHTKLLLSVAGDIMSRTGSAWIISTRPLTKSPTVFIRT